MARRKPKLISPIHVIDIAQKGKTIGKDEDGQVYLLDSAVPGDQVEFLYYKKRKGLPTGKVTKILSYSEDRVTPKCQHFDVCGGCQLQNLDYTKQLYYKEKVVKDAIRKIAKDDTSKVLPILGAKETFKYRNKLKYSFGTDRWLTQEEIDSDQAFEKENSLGYHISGSYYKIVPIENCLLQEDKSNEIRNYIHTLSQEKGYSYFDIRENVGLFRNLMIRDTTLGEWMIMVIFGEDNVPLIEEVLGHISARFPELTSIYYMINLKQNDSFFDLPQHLFTGATHIKEKLGGLTFKIGPKSFFQTNTRQTIALYDKIVAFAELKPTDIVYDLYTGVGSIALYLAEHCKSIVGVETIAEAIEDAEDNCTYNQITNATFYTGEVKDVLDDQFIENHGKPDVVIIDPPRIGIHAKVVKQLLEIASPTLVYVSCNPSTQARDIELLKEKYDLVKVIPVDMFPHTYHIESIAQLKLRS